MVFSDSMSLIGSPPTNRALAPPLPFSPWHMEHFAAKIRAPSAAVPLPGGRPVPSGRMLMFQAAISAGVRGFPRFGDCAKAAFELRTSVSTKMYPPSLCVDILHLSTALDRPARDGVVVLVRKSCD